MWSTFGLEFRDFMPITDSILGVNDQKIDQFIEQITRHSTPRLLDQSHWTQQDLNLYFNIMNIKFYLLN